MKQIDNFTDQVIKTIESTRQEIGITTQELIKRSGLRRSTFFRKMRGDTSFTTEDIDALALALGTDPFLILRKASKKADDVRLQKKPQIDLTKLSEDEKIKLVLAKLEAGDQTLAASINPYKEHEKEGGDGR